MRRMKNFTRLEAVFRAAVRAARMSSVCNIQENARMSIPQFHARSLIGAKDTAVVIQIFGQ